MNASLKAAAVWLALTVSAAGAAGVDPALKTFLGAFSDAVGAGATATVAGMAHFPLQNEAYQQPKTVSKSGFNQQFGFMKGKVFAACLKTTPPKRAAADNRRLGEWSVDCDGNVFYFAKFDGQWRYSGYENVNE